MFVVMMMMMMMVVAAKLLMGFIPAQSIISLSASE